MAVEHIREVNQINQTHKWSCKIWSIAVFLGLKEQNFYYFKIIAKSVNTLTERLSPVKKERKRFIFLKDNQKQLNNFFHVLSKKCYFINKKKLDHILLIKFMIMITATYNLNIIDIISKVTVDIFLNHSLQFNIPTFLFSTSCGRSLKK